jgi:uncharacterized protein YuzE
MHGTERTVRVTYEYDTDMGYIYLAEIPDGGVSHTEPLIIDTPAGIRLINLDFDAGGALVGIEFEGASGVMPSRLIAGLA